MHIDTGCVNTSETGVTEEVTGTKSTRVEDLAEQKKSEGILVTQSQNLLTAWKAAELL